MTSDDGALPQVRLSRTQKLRMVLVGILVVLAIARTVPDVVRIVYPISFFGYTTDGDGVVVSILASPPPSTAPSAPGTATAARATSRRRHGAIAATLSREPVDALKIGDRVRVDRIRPFDRKPGIVGTRAFTYDNPDRHLPIERNGRERVLHLAARHESPLIRFLDMLRILLFLIAVGLGSILFLVKPSIATAAFFVFCLGAVEAPATWLDLAMPQPWREYPQAISDFIRGCLRPALLLFALCLIDGDTDLPRERIFAWFAGALALILGGLNAYSQWLLTYGAHPAQYLIGIVQNAAFPFVVMTGVALGIAFWRARPNDRHRIGWIVAAFVLAGIARQASDWFYPRYIPFWLNSILVSMTIVPIVTIWIAVVRHRFFNVDFVVSRAVVYAALTAAFLGTLGLIEEIGTYLFYNNTDFAYGWLILASTLIGAGTARLAPLLVRGVDRFIFRNRRQQREALEFIAGYILDAETVEDVYRALLQDAAHALQLSFGGILARQPDGGYVLSQSYAWPEDYVVKLGPSDAVTRAITRTRGALTFSGRDTRLIQQSFPNERLTFAAPLFFDRTVSGIVVYGHNVSGLDLDPEEREQLVRVVAHASIALNTIELSRYRGERATPAPLPSAAS